MGSEVGPVFSWTVPCRGFEETSVSMECEIRKLWKGGDNIAEDETAESAPSLLVRFFFIVMVVRVKPHCWALFTWFRASRGDRETGIE